MPDNKIIIRAAEEQDCQALHRLLNGLADAVGDSGKLVSTVDDLRRYGFGDKPLFDAMVAESDGEVVAICIYFYSFSTWLGTPGVYVQDLFVDAPVRSSGIGRKLLAATAAAARAQHADHLRLSVYDDNESAQRFYETIGMRHRRDECIYQADGETFEQLANEAGES